MMCVGIMKDSTRFVEKCYDLTIFGAGEIENIEDTIN